MIKQTLFLFAVIASLLTACTHGIKKEALYGDWKYVKINKTDGDALADTLTATQLAEQDPYISFKANNELIIHWGGKVLSHGTFVIDNNNINYTEQLGEGKTRTFPFFVSKLDDKNIVFETLDKNGSRVAAVKK